MTPSFSRVQYSTYSLLLSFWLAAAQNLSAELTFDSDIAPLFGTYCYECHGGDSVKGHLDMVALGSREAYLRDFHLLEDLEWIIEERDMPPIDAEKQPSDSDREKMVEWIRDQLNYLRDSTPGDPGVVVMPRLTRSAYRNVIESVTGYEYGVDQYLPQDSAAGEGFTNVGEAHSMAPADVEKYLQSAEFVLSHARVSPSAGITWYGSPQQEISEQKLRREELVDQWSVLMTVESERRSRNHWEPIKKATGWTHAAYLKAAWDYKSRFADDGEHLEIYVQESASYLDPVFFRRWWHILHRPESNHYLGQVYSRWRTLPETLDEGAQQAVFDDLEHRLLRLESLPRYGWNHGRPAFERNTSEYRNQRNRDIRNGRREIVLELNKLREDFQQDHFYIVVTSAGDSLDQDFLEIEFANFVFEDGVEVPWPGKPIEAIQPPALLKVEVPEGALEFHTKGKIDLDKHPDAALQFAAIDFEPQGLDREYLPRFPVIGGSNEDSQARILVSDLLEARTRLLTPSTERTGGVSVSVESWFTSFDDLKVSDFIKRIRDLQPDIESPYRYTDADIMRHIGGDVKEEAEALHAAILSDFQPKHFELFRIANEVEEEWTNENLVPSAQLFDALQGADKSRVLQLIDEVTLIEKDLSEAAFSVIRKFADDFWRYPATDDEIAALHNLYLYERAKGSPFDLASKTALTAAMLSPHFLYRWQTSKETAEITDITDRELSERIAFILWNAPPDQELQELAEAARLSDPEILRAQIQRMMRDPKIEALAYHFFGYWLGFAHFEDYTAPDPKLYPTFTAEIRSAMQNESLYFFTELMRSNTSLSHVVEANYTWLNEGLADYYGIEGVEGDEFRKVYLPPKKRGGLFGMGSILTVTSTPMRTSPVIRGTWLVTSFLGEPMPEPPPVPALSEGETSETGLTIPQQLALHRSNPTCAGCHNRIDPPGLALENFDAVGRWREEYSVGNGVENEAVLADGTTFSGIQGLRSFAMDRKEQWMETLTRRFLGYALGRAVIPSDFDLIDQTVSRLMEEADTPEVLLESIFLSPQFLKRRNEITSL